MAKLLAAPFRLAIGLPAFYGMSVWNRVLQTGRALGLYSGPIHYVMTAPALRFGIEVNDGLRK